jgi:hypothetical protein
MERRARLANQSAAFSSGGETGAARRELDFQVFDIS